MPKSSVNENAVATFGEDDYLLTDAEVADVKRRLEDALPRIKQALAQIDADKRVHPALWRINVSSIPLQPPVRRCSPNWKEHCQHFNGKNCCDCRPSPQRSEATSKPPTQNHEKGGR